MPINNELSLTLELKNIKQTKGHDMDCPAWTATVYVDGVRSFIAEDEGYGACELQYSPIAKNDQVIINKLQKEASKVTYLCELDKGAEYNKSLCIILSELFEDFLKEKEFKKQLKKVSYINKGNVYNLGTKLKPTQENIEIFKKVDWFEDKFVILNELSFEKGFVLYKEATRPRHYQAQG